MRNELTVKPLETYKPPSVPTLAESRKNPDFLKKLPLRWRKSAAVLAAAGLLGTFMLAGAGCAEQVTRNPAGSGTEAEIFTPTPYTQDDLLFRMHTGGSGGVYYVVYFTEQEMLGIIRAQLEMAGLRFGGEPPDYRVGWDEQIGIDLYDDALGVAVTRLDYSESNPGFGSTGMSSAVRYAQDFSQQNKDITFGVFFTSGGATTLNPYNYRIDDDDWWNFEDPPEDEVEEAKAFARPMLEENLNWQIEEFIKLLTEKGII
jgi:hypothetical protein